MTPQPNVNVGDVCGCSGCAHTHTAQKICTGQKKQNIRRHQHHASARRRERPSRRRLQHTHHCLESSKSWMNLLLRIEKKTKIGWKQQAASSQQLFTFASRVRSNAVEPAPATGQAGAASGWIDGRAGQPERRRRGRGRASGIMLQWGTRRSSALRVMVNAEHACR